PFLRSTSGCRRSSWAAAPFATCARPGYALFLGRGSLRRVLPCLFFRRGGRRCMLLRSIAGGLFPGRLRLARSHTAEGALCGILFGHLLAGAAAGTFHLTVDPHFADVDLAFSAAFRMDHEIDPLAAFLAPLQQAALTVAILLFDLLQIEMLVQQTYHDLARTIE